MTDPVGAKDTRYIRTSNVVATDMDGETVMMDIHKGAYFALSGSGTHIWERLQQPARLDEIVEALGDKYETAGVQDIETIVSNFVASLVDKGLVQQAD